LQILLEGSDALSNPPEHKHFRVCAAEFWPKHFAVFESAVPELDPDTLILLRKLFDPKNPSHFFAWLRIHDSLDPEAGAQPHKPLTDFSDMSAYIKLLDLPILIKPVTQTQQHQSATTNKSVSGAHIDHQEIRAASTIYSPDDSNDPPNQIQVA
jgi:hypothetical protein